MPAPPSHHSTDISPEASVRVRRRFRCHPGLTLLALITVVSTAWLSHWQFRRAAEKMELQVQFEAQQTRPAASTVAMLDGAQDRYARVKVAGRFLSDSTVMHDNQILNGRAGVHVFTAFQPDETQSPSILINRGWMAMPPQRNLLAAPSAPNAPLIVEGRINLTAARTKRLAQGADSLSLKQTISIDDLSQQFGRRLYPFIIEQTQPEPGLTQQWIAPDFKIATHRMYAGQWACFSVLAAALWLVLSFRKEKR